MKLSMILTVAMAGGFAFAMPTRKELKDASPVVRNRLAEEQRAVAEGRKTRTEVADAAVIMAASASSNAEKLLLLKGAFVFYVKDGKYDKASETLGALRIAIDRLPDETVDSIVKDVEGVVGRENRPRFLRAVTAGLKSETVDGVTWHYRETSKGIEIGTGLENVAAVDEDTAGRLVIPNEIHGKLVTCVDNWALYGCSRVESVCVPRHATFKVNSFTGCGNLQAIETDPNHPQFKSVDGMVISKDGTWLVRCPEGRRSVTVPEGVTMIGPDTFCDCRQLESVVIPDGDGIIQISGGAFRGCASLTSVKMSSNVTMIDKTAFEGCDRLSPKPSVPGGLRERTPESRKASYDDTGWRRGPTEAWFVNVNKAFRTAKGCRKPLFVLKAGSDWCPWSAKLYDNVLSRPEFVEFAARNLVLVYVDNPSKKNSLCEAQQRHNQRIVQLMRLGGDIPSATVITAEGKKLGVIDGGDWALDAYLQKLGEIVGKPALAPATGCKLPYDLMPKDGLIADFDFSDAITNKIGSTRKLFFTDARIVNGALWFEGESVYGGKKRIGGRRYCPRVAEIPLPGLDYDHFTIAMSFAPEQGHKGAGDDLPIFVLCKYYRKLEINVSSEDEITLNVESMEVLKTGLKVKRGIWNWFACSVDAVGKRIVIAVNGQLFGMMLPDDFCWRFPSGEKKAEESNATLFTHLGMGSATKGFVDDLLVYNRAFGRTDLEALAGGCRSGDTSAAK